MHVRNYILTRMLLLAEGDKLLLPHLNADRLCTMDRHTCRAGKQVRAQFPAFQTMSCACQQFENVRPIDQTGIRQNFRRIELFWSTRETLPILRSRHPLSSQTFWLSYNPTFKYSVHNALILGQMNLIHSPPTHTRNNPIRHSSPT
jgi:hypothetical protein